MNVTAIVSGERDVAARLDELPDRVHQRLVEPITRLTRRLLGLYQAAEPSRTGKLRQETVSHVEVSRDLVRGRVTVAASTANEFAKAGALEYGAHGTAHVAAFERRGHAPYGAPADQMVAAYSRHLDLAEHRFARGALDEMRGEIKETLEAAIGGGRL